jgi:NTE family protein
MPFALTVVELPSLRSHIVREHEITWKHLAASCAIPFGYPPIEIGGRLYVDGGLRGGLPLWAAEALGARRALALNVLNGAAFRMLRRVTLSKRATEALDVTLLEPSRRLGSLRDALIWNARNVERWIELGRLDASSITM